MNGLIIMLIVTAGVAVFDFKRGNGFYLTGFLAVSTAIAWFYL